jgi:uncharacterized membrane protein
MANQEQNYGEVEKDNKNAKGRTGLVDRILVNPFFFFLIFSGYTGGVVECMV